MSAEIPRIRGRYGRNGVAATTATVAAAPKVPSIAPGETLLRGTVECEGGSAQIRLTLRRSSARGTWGRIGIFREGTQVASVDGGVGALSVLIQKLVILRDELAALVHARECDGPEESR